MRTNFYRIMAIIIAIIYPLLGWIYKLSNPEIVERMQQRFLFSGLFLILVLASYFIGKIRDNFKEISYFLFFLLSVHSIYLNNLNWHIINYAYGISFILIAGNIMIKSVTAMLSYNLLLYMLIIISVVTAPIAFLSKLIYLFFTTLLITILIFVNYFEIRLWKRLNQKVVEQKRMKKKLEYRVQLDKIITNLSTYFINLAPEKLESGINSSLKQIGEFINADCSHLVVFNMQTEILKSEYKWCKENKKDFDLQNISKVKFPDLIAELEEFKVAYFKQNKVDTKLQREMKVLAEQLAAEELVVIPLISANNLLGYILFAAKKEQAWSEKIIILLKIAGEIFTNGIERKRDYYKLSKHTMDLELTNLKLEETSNKLNNKIAKAKELHEQFLTKQFPQVEEISFAAHYYPAENLGGDFYNVLQVGDKIITYIVDITGHGLDGAMLNIFVRESINSYLLAHYQAGDDLEPAKILEFVFQRYKEENFPEDYFICLMLGVLDISSKEYVFVNAGIQFYPVLIDQFANVKEIKVAGLPISNTIADEMFYYKNIREEKIEFNKGDALFMVTDGLIEEEKDGQVYGEKRFRRVLEKSSNKTIDEMIIKINNDFRRFAGSIQGQDDITILAVQRDM